MTPSTQTPYSKIQRFNDCRCSFLLRKAIFLLFNRLDIMPVWSAHCLTLQEKYIVVDALWFTVEMSYVHQSSFLLISTPALEMGMSIGFIGFYKNKIT